MYQGFFDFWREEDWYKRLKNTSVFPKVYVIYYKILNKYSITISYLLNLI